MNAASNNASAPDMSRYACAQPLNVISQVMRYGYNLVTSFEQIDRFEKVLIGDNEFCVVMSVQPGIIDRACVRKKKKKTDDV
jgi:hypothetical protein